MRTFLLQHLVLKVFPRPLLYKQHHYLYIYIYVWLQRWQSKADVLRKYRNSLMHRVMNIKAKTVWINIKSESVRAREAERLKSRAFACGQSGRWPYHYLYSFIKTAEKKLLSQKKNHMLTLAVESACDSIGFDSLRMRE